jgi:hypothetical protein
MEKQYLGDGVYASFDGYQIKLETLEGNVIYLEPPVMRALTEYVRKCYAMDATDYPESVTS